MKDKKEPNGKRTILIKFKTMKNKLNPINSNNISLNNKKNNLYQKSNQTKINNSSIINTKNDNIQKIMYKTITNFKLNNKNTKKNELFSSFAVNDKDEISKNKVKKINLKKTFKKLEDNNTQLKTNKSKILTHREHEIKPLKKEDDKKIIANKLARAKTIGKDHKTEPNVNESHPNNQTYTNLYDKYYDKFKYKILQRKKINNYKDDKYNNIPNKSTINIHSNINKNILKKTLTVRDLKSSRKPKKKIEEKKNFETSKLNANKDKGNKAFFKRRMKSTLKVIKKKENETEAKEEKPNKMKMRSKSSSNLNKIIKPKKIKNEDNDGIENILFGKESLDVNEDPFDDIDSVVKKIDFSSVKLFAKNIFSLEYNDKYKKYSEKFDNMFSDFVKKKKQSKSKESSENKIDSNISNLHSEKTTDSFKKNQVNISFIDNQS
jgi:hypothetical protein